MNKPTKTILFILVCLATTVSAGKLDKEGFIFDAFVKLDDTSIRAIKKAQEWLASSQYSDGSWSGEGRKNTGVAAFAIMALMIGGDVPGEGEYAKNIGMGIQFLLNQQRESGVIYGDEKRAIMYQHALATLALTEAYGMSRNPRIRTAIIKAINLIVQTQSPEGGWRYMPKIQKGDISATVMQVMALKAAVEAGIYVPDDTMKRAIKFIKGCYNPKEKGFAYMMGRGGAKFARTAAGMVSLQTVGLHNDPVIPDVVQYLMKHGDPNKKEPHYWYGHYYMSVGLYHYGGPSWKAYYPKIKKKILKDWEKRGHHNDVLSTAWAVMILGVPYRYLPIYQR
jgi:hypothetical protein